MTGFKLNVTVSVTHLAQKCLTALLGCGYGLFVGRGGDNPVSPTPTPGGTEASHLWLPAREVTGRAYSPSPSPGRVK